MSTITKVTLYKRRNQWGEYVVRAYTADGRRFPPGDYYSNSWDDAQATYAAMLAAIADQNTPDYCI